MGATKKNLKKERCSFKKMKNMKKMKKKSIRKTQKKDKKYKKFRKNMKGGVADFGSSSRPLNIGDGIKANSTFSESDTPSSPPSVVSFIPSPIMDLKWSFDTGLRNFFNEIFGQPRQFTSSPTDQPIGKMVAPPIVPGLTQSGLLEHQKAIIDTYNNN